MQIRVSSEISNAPLILNVDCDMYSNNSQSIKDALCFFLDQDAGHDVAFVQFPQNFHNLTNNELYGSLRVISQVMHVKQECCNLVKVLLVHIKNTEIYNEKY